MSNKTECALLPEKYKGCTPGPWIVDEPLSVHPSVATISAVAFPGRSIADVIGETAIDEMNARLIADAPALACEVQRLRAATDDKDAEIVRLSDDVLILQVYLLKARGLLSVTEKRFSRSPGRVKSIIPEIKSFLKESDGVWSAKPGEIIAASQAAQPAEVA